jgi:2-oxoglutarate dehydrogenase E2 component (dihydrolipoamide succinyltransferase)
LRSTIGEFGKKAKDGSLTVEEMTGGTFTITNGGVFGSLMSTPILNPPQSGILGMHATKDRPVAENGQDRDPADDVRRPFLRPPHH